MKTKLIVLITVLFACLSIEAKPKKKVQITPQAPQYTEWSYYQDPFTVTRYSMDEAIITSPVSDGMQAPLPFRVIRGELSDLDFRETLIFITDNLSEAYHP